MTQPSKFIFNTDYATTQNDDIKKFSVVIPNSFIVHSQPYYVVDQEFTIGQLAAGMRMVIQSSKYSTKLINPSTLFIPATYHSQALGADIPSNLLCYIIRSAPGKVRIRITPNYGYGFQSGDSFFDCGQTLTLAIQTFLNPFEN